MMYVYLLLKLTFLKNVRKVEFLVPLGIGLVFDTSTGALFYFDPPTFEIDDRIIYQWSQLQLNEFFNASKPLEYEELQTLKLNHTYEFKILRYDELTKKWYYAGTICVCQIPDEVATKPP